MLYAKLVLSGVRQNCRRTLTVAVVLLSTFSSVCVAADEAATSCSREALQGSWELQSAIYRDKSGKVVGEIKDQQTKSRKLIAGSHFSFITWHPDGKFVVAASGHFSADATGYKEQIDTTSEPRLQGKKYHFQCSVNGDKWLHHGLEDDIQIEEHWLRISGEHQ